MAISTWTTADLAQMTQLAMNLDKVDSNQQYCNHCTVVLVTDTDMCDSCINEVVAYLQASEEAYYARIAEEAQYQAQFGLTA